MWIVPKNYQQSSVSAQGMAALSEDLSLPGLNIEQSLMWRSKPSPLRTWLRRWKRDKWFRLLCGRILKPCQHNAFETELTCSLAAIPVNHSVRLESEKVQKTPDTSGRTSNDMSKQLDLFDASSRTSKDTSTLDLEKSLETWKSLVTRLRGEYSARLKSARLTRESGSTSLPTPQTGDYRTGSSPGSKRMKRKVGQKWSQNLNDYVVQWPTPTASDYKGSGPTVIRKDGKDRSKDRLDYAVEQQPNTTGKLNPQWVEWLMGLSTGWTDLGSWGTE